MSSYISFTAVVPSYNQGKYLEETLRSLVNQDYPKLNIVVMDGGSTDNSVDIIKRYESKLAYWVSEKDKGQSDAIIKGFARAKGNWLLWLNSDDVLYPGALEYANGIIQETNPDILTGSTYWCDQHGYIIRYLEARPIWQRMILAGLAPISQPSTFFKRSKYEEVGGLKKDLHICMDSDLWTRMVAADAEIAISKKPLAFFRKHPESKGAVAHTQWKKEQSAYYNSCDGGDINRCIIRGLFKLRCFLGGVYLRDYLRTHKLRHVQLSDIWSWNC